MHSTKEARYGVPAHRPALHAAASAQKHPPPRESTRPPVLLVARDPGARAGGRGGRPAGLRTLEAPDALQGRMLLEQVGTGSDPAGVMGLKPERVQALRKLREVLGGATVPILALADPQDQQGSSARWSPAIRVCSCAAARPTTRSSGSCCRRRRGSQTDLGASPASPAGATQAGAAAQPSTTTASSVHTAAKRQFSPRLTR